MEDESYFVVHAPRQIGKTTALMALAEELTTGGKYAAVLVSAEQGRGFPTDVGATELAILHEWASAAKDLPPPLRPPPWPEAPPGDRVRTAPEAWAEHCPRPLVVFIDEIDTASPFNIKVESLTLRNFTRDEVAELYAQHTADTGQAFEPAAVTRAHALCDGQPWLVNAMARQVVQQIRPDRTQPVVAADFDEAARRLVDRQDTHLDSLAERLREPRIRAIIEPMLAGGLIGDVPEDDRRFAIDLGLVKRADGGGLEIANPIYREVIVRSLAGGLQDTLPRMQPSWLDAQGRLDPDAL